jgi:tetratricopeptide (TPR) repeat protein
VSGRAVILVLGASAVLGILLGFPGTARRAGHATPADTAIASRSIAFFEGRLRADSGNTLIAGHLADRYVQRFMQSARMQDVDRAVALAHEILNGPVPRAPALARLASLHLMRHAFSDAYTTARAAVDAQPDHEGALAALFDAAMATGRTAVADSALEQLDRNTVTWRLRQAHRLDEQGRADAAFANHEKVCDRLERSALPASTQAWCLAELAGIEHARSGPSAAERLYLRALRIQPGARGAIEGLADLHHARGEWQDARDLYLRIATDAHPDLYQRLAETAQQLGDADETAHWEREFLRVASVPEAEPLFANFLGHHYAASDEREDLDAALGLALRDLERRDTKQAWDLLARVRFRRGELAAALDASDRAIERGTPSPTTLYHRARILDALGRQSEALAAMTEALADRTQIEPHARLDACVRNGAAPALCLQEDEIDEANAKTVPSSRAGGGLLRRAALAVRGT